MAWLKILVIQRAVDSEIAFFMVTETEDPFFVTDVVVIKQRANWAKFELDDEAMAIFMAQMYEKGICPDQCRRIVGHTHPGTSADPSMDDMSEFMDHFEGMDWHAMFIRAQGGKCTCRLRVRTVPSAHLESNQTLMMLDRELPVLVMPLGRYPNNEAMLTLDDWGAERLLAMGDVIRGWIEEARSLCTPFPKKDPYYNPPYTTGHGGTSQTQQEKKEIKEVLDSISQDRRMFLLSRDSTLQIPWAEIGKRYKMSAQEIEDLKDDYEIDPAFIHAEIEKQEAWLKDYTQWLASPEGMEYLADGGSDDFRAWIGGESDDTDGPEAPESKAEAEARDAELDATLRTYGI